MKTVTLNNNVYEMSDKLANQLIKTASEATRGTFTLYATIKGDHIEMRRDTFLGEKALRKYMAEFIREGFTVKYHTRSTNAS